MNEQPYKEEHLQEYTGILTSDDARNERFKMELKVEDNPVMERWTQKDKSTIELEFKYNLGPSMMFFDHIHNRHTCKIKDCPKCERIRKTYDIFAANLYDLQFGDTFKIQAALINNDQSVLPAEIHNFQRYQPLWVAGTEYPLRLPDTPEGINKKQRAAEKIPKWRRTKKSIQQFLGDRPYITQIIISTIGGLIAGVILTTFIEPIPRLFRWIISFF